MESVRRIVLAMAGAVLLAIPVAAQQADSKPAPSPLVQLLQSKGILTAEEAATVGQASSPAEANQRLAQLLLSKGLISSEEYNRTVAASAVPVAQDGANGAHVVNAVLKTGAEGAPAAGSSAGASAATSESAAEPKVVPAIAPVRVLPINVPRDPKGIIPDIKLGSGAMLNLYGFLKASAVYDSSNSGGNTFGSNDFPLPLLLGDTGPEAGSQFRFKARSARAGVNFYYPINGPNITLTGKMEFDWEGDYTIVNNRNISSIRSSQLSLRVAWMRMDAKLGDVPWFAEFGQDWTILGSSTLPDYFETTGLGVGFGSFYERAPQFKTGLQFSAGSWKIQPELAVTLGAFGDSGLNNSVTQTVLGSLGQVPIGQQNQGREGAILGPASGQPGVQGRIVFDFPLNKSWKGVANSELIISGGHSEAAEIVPAGNIPTTAITSLTTPNTVCTTASVATPASVRCYYPTGLRLNIPQNAFTAEVQLPTPWFTLVSKYYRGGDMRFFFTGQLNTAFADTQAGAPISIPGTQVLCTFGTTGCTGGAVGTPGTATLTQNVFSYAGDAITFVNPGTTCTTTPTNCIAQVAPLRPIRGQGGFVQLGFPLSRIFGADPEGRQGGWTFYVGYGVDSAFARDVIRSGGNNLLRSDYVPISLRYKINKWASIINETTWYDTRTADTKTQLVRGIPAHVNHDWRNEFGTVFTF